MDSKQTRRSVLAAGPLTAAAMLTPGAGAAHAGSSTSTWVPDELRPEGELDRYIVRLAAEDRFSGTVLVTHRGKPVLSRSHHWADRERRIRNGPDTIFVLGSIPKVFTGVAIGQLAQQGKVRYHDTIGTFLDGFASDVAGTVTVHQLLTHTSGLADFHSEEFFRQASTWDTVDEFWAGVMRFVRKCELTFTPGSGNTYSNAAFVILGAIVAQVSGRSYYDYIREHIFERAGMRVSDFYTTPHWREDRRIAHPYGEPPTGGGRVDVLDRNLLIGTPSGGGFASAPDLARFARAFQENKLLEPAHTYLVASPKSPIPQGEAGNFAAYSMSARLGGGQWNYGKNGGSNGVNGNVDWFPDPDLVVAVLANYSEPAAKLVATKARQLITGQPTAS